MNEKKMKDYKTKKILKVLIIIFSIITITTSILYIFKVISFIYAIISFLITKILEWKNRKIVIGK